MNQWIRWPEENGPAWRWLAGAMGMPALLATPPRALADMTLAASRLADDTREKFVMLLGEDRVRQDHASRLRHAPQANAADRLRFRAGDAAGAPDVVLRPRNQDDVVSLLRICSEDGVAVTPFGTGMALEAREAEQKARVSLDLSDLNRLLSLDAASGLAEIEAGITGAELETRLSASGFTLGEELGAGTLGGWIARDRACSWLRGATVATPRGIATGLTHIVPGSRGAFGVITRATLLVYARPAVQDLRGWLFPDFAAGLAALREAARLGIAHENVALADAAETRFRRGMTRMENLGLRERLSDIYRGMRRFDHQAAALAVTFSGSAAEVKSRRRQFAALAQRLGAMRWTLRRDRDLRDDVLDRGVTLDRLSVTASWSRLPALYAGVRAALDQAMRRQALRQGAHGLVLAQVTRARADGAQLDFCWLFPRGLQDDTAQAQTVRQAALDAAGYDDDPLARDVARGIKQALDPKGILPAVG